jgi:hypothetical protein
MPGRKFAIALACGGCDWHNHRIQLEAAACLTKTILSIANYRQRARRRLLVRIH